MKTAKSRGFGPVHSADFEWATFDTPDHTWDDVGSNNGPTGEESDTADVRSKFFASEECRPGGIDWLFAYTECWDWDIRVIGMRPLQVTLINQIISQISSPLRGGFLPFLDHLPATHVQPQRPSHPSISYSPRNHLLQLTSAQINGSHYPLHICVCDKFPPGTSSICKLPILMHNPRHQQKWADSGEL